jgi:hypothetical protein
MSDWASALGRGGAPPQRATLPAQRGTTTWGTSQSAAPAKKPLLHWLMPRAQPHYNIFMNTFAVAISTAAVLEWNRVRKERGHKVNPWENVAAATIGCLVAYYLLYALFGFAP